MFYFIPNISRLNVIRGDNLKSVRENLGRLEKSLVQTLENECKENNKIKLIFHSIVELYENDAQHIPVIGNSKLNKQFTIIIGNRSITL